MLLFSSGVRGPRGVIGRGAAFAKTTQLSATSTEPRKPPRREEKNLDDICLPMQPGFPPDVHSCRSAALVLLGKQFAFLSQRASDAGPLDQSLEIGVDLGPFGERDAGIWAPVQSRNQVR